MKVQRIAAFSDNGSGGNPAGVVLLNELPSTRAMQNLAARVGYSETVFAARKSDFAWRVRYFSPETEVPFCGHATIALGAALAEAYGEGKYLLQLNTVNISVQGAVHGSRYKATLQSPPTYCSELSSAKISPVLDLFGLNRTQIDARLPFSKIHAGADHYVVALRDRHDLRNMSYPLKDGRNFMNKNNLVTIMFVWVENNQKFHVRNAFASGGVLEDPATGAAAAAFSGYLRDLDWPHKNKIEIIQGEDMGQRSIIHTEFDDVAGSPINVSGQAHQIK